VSISTDRIRLAPEEANGLGNYGKSIALAQTEEEIISIVQYAAENSLSVIPEGGGTKRGFGGITEKADLLLSLKQYNGVVEYSEGDMTMTVRAGTPIAEIADFLKPFKQMLPIDPCWPTHATIGGVIAANDSGPKRLRYGSARDLVIGTRVVYPDGRLIRTGGKVVKNVAGYDMNKLFIGSMGTLGVLTEITVKLRPLPKYQSLVLLSLPAADIRSFATRILDSMIEPVTLELLSSNLSEKLTGQKQPTLAIGFEDMEKAVRYQEDWITANRPTDSQMQILREVEVSNWWGEFAKLPPIGGAEDDMDVALKIGSKNLEVIDRVQLAEQLAVETGVQVQAHGGLGHGLTKAYLKGEQNALAAYIQKLRSVTEESGGYTILQHAPLTLRQQVDPWGKKPAYYPLIEGIKNSIDPKRVLNPKRFIGGI
jgi:glycolate oxidase FAD binding subunit